MTPEAKHYHPWRAVSVAECGAVLFVNEMFPFHPPEFKAWLIGRLSNYMDANLRAYFDVPDDKFKLPKPSRN